MTWDKIVSLYLEIEQLLIGSFRRNLAGHKAWEEKEGFQWSAWQAEKLGNMENFRRENKKLMQPYREAIDKATREMMVDQYNEGYAYVTQEAEQAGFPTTEESFFGVNKKRLNAITKDILGREERAETAALRMTDDVYRQTVYKAHLSMAAGAQTLPQALDMAAKDFLSRGITCIEYADGSRHNIADYAQMALTTAATRSYLQGEAQKRAELGIDTVIVSSYGGCSPTCLPWQGRVYIDDVWGEWSGERRGDKGLSNNGKWYLLLSIAVESGLFHPHCRHILSTWFEGISTLPEPLDEKTVRENYRLEQQQRAKENALRKLKRLAEGTQDPVLKAGYKKKVREAQKDLREFIADHSDVLRRDYWREKTHEIPA